MAKKVVLEIIPANEAPTFQVTMHLATSEYWWEVARRIGTSDGAVDETWQMYYPPHSIRAIRMVSGDVRGERYRDVIDAVTRAAQANSG